VLPRQRGLSVRGAVALAKLREPAPLIPQSLSPLLTQLVEHSEERESRVHHLDECARRTCETPPVERRF